MILNKEEEKLIEILKSYSKEDLQETLKKYQESDPNGTQLDRLKQATQQPYRSTLPTVQEYNEREKERRLSNRPKAIDGRTVGNSTRLIDYYIQELFNKRVVCVADHSIESLAHNLLMKRVLNRLRTEHRLEEGSNLLVNRQQRTIKFINK